MVKNKIAGLLSGIFLLLILCSYQIYRFNNYKKFFEKKITREHQILEIKKLFANPKFLKKKEKIFEKNENLKQNILKIFKNREINHVFFKKIAENNFEIKFKTSNEEKIYKIINEIRKNLSGVILFDEITIDKKENTLSIKLIFRVFYPSENLRKHIYINKISKENICEIFHLEKPKKYQLNGILHYDIAYINGEPFHVGDTIGGCQISDIQDEFITIKNGKNSIQINIDDRW